jgi:predicted HTH domain antitoxin
MAVTIDIPADAERLLRQAFGDDLERTALEAIAVEAYRGGKLTTYEVQLLLGFEDRWETETWLGGRGVFRNYGPEDLEADRETLQRVLGPVQR